MLGFMARLIRRFRGIHYIGRLFHKWVSVTMNTKKWWVASIILVLSNIVSIAHASDGEAAWVVEHCRSAITFSGSQASDPAVAMNIGFCFGLMDGVRGANFYLKKAKSEVAFCEPPIFKNDDLAKVFVATVDKNPHLLELRGSLAVLVALRNAFPCKGAK